MKFTFTHRDLIVNVGCQPTCFPKLQTLVDTWIVMFSGLSYLQNRIQVILQTQEKVSRRFLEKYLSKSNPLSELDDDDARQAMIANGTQTICLTQFFWTS